jgi:hypothetical protein
LPQPRATIGASSHAGVEVRSVGHPLRGVEEQVMSHVVDFGNVSTTGLESSPVAPTLAGSTAKSWLYLFLK